jgi:hypothetical protein
MFCAKIRGFEEKCKKKTAEKFVDFSAGFSNYLRSLGAAGHIPSL